MLKSNKCKSLSVMSLSLKLPGTYRQILLSALTLTFSDFFLSHTSHTHTSLILISIIFNTSNISIISTNTFIMFHTDDLIDLSSVASSSALVTSSPASLASSSAPVAVQLRGKYPVQNFHGPFVDANPACSHHHKYTSYEPGLWPCEGCGM